MTNMGRFRGTACILLTILVSLFTACGTGTQQQASTQPASQTTTGDSPSQPTTPSTPPTPSQPPTPTPTPVPPGPDNYYFSYNGRVYGFELHIDGSLTRTPGSPYDSGSEVQNSGTPSLSATGDFVFVPNSVNCAYGECLGTNSIATFARDMGTGGLTRTQLTQVGTYPGHLLTDSTGKLLYSGEWDRVRGFTIDVNGDLTAAAWSPFKDAEAILVRHPSLPVIYSVSAGRMFPSGRITAFRTDDPDGTPVLLKDMPIRFEELGNPTVRIDPNGKFLFILINGNTNTPNLFVFSISSNGEPQQVVGSPFNAPATISSGSADAGLALDPQLRWVYVSSAELNGTISQYLFDSSRGSIGPFLSSIPSADIHVENVDPTGRFLLAVRSTQLLVYEIDSSTGHLTLLNATEMTAR